MVRQRLSKLERKKHIQHIAKDIILHKGFENTTMKDIVDATNMSTGGVYHYYKSVSQIFYDIMSEGLDYADNRNFFDTKNDINKFISFQLEKIYDDNEYKSLFAILLQGISKNEELKHMYLELNNKYISIMHSKFATLDKRILDNKFLVLLIHSLVLGYESFDVLGSKQVFKDNKNFIRQVIISYLNSLTDKEEL